MKHKHVLVVENEHEDSLVKGHIHITWAVLWSTLGSKAYAMNRMAAWNLAHPNIKAYVVKIESDFTPTY